MFSLDDDLFAQLGEDQLGEDAAATGEISQRNVYALPECYIYKSLINFEGHIVFTAVSHSLSSSATA